MNSVLKLLADDFLSKYGHPNIGGMQTRGPRYDTNKWAMTLQNILNIVNVNGIDRDIAFNNLTKDWDEEEKNNFEHWIRYYEENNTEKYNVKTAKFIKEAFGPTINNIPDSLLSGRNSVSPQFSTFKADDRKTQKELDMDRARAIKTKIKSRIRALKSLMDKYNDLLPHQDLDKIFVEIHALEKSISKLNVHASLQDCIIRSANRINKFGFKAGADILYKFAEDPASDIPNLPPGSAAASNVQSIINKLEGINNQLASRNLIRDLATSDILLNELGLASYFPELSLAQAKLIEAFGYSSNKVEDVIARLRGTGTSKSPKPESKSPAPLPTAPVAPVKAPPAATSIPVQGPPAEQIKTEDLMEKPVGQLQKELPTKPKQ